MFPVLLSSSKGIRFLFQYPPDAQHQSSALALAASGCPAPLLFAAKSNFFQGAPCPYWLSRVFTKSLYSSFVLLQLQPAELQPFGSVVCGGLCSHFSAVIMSRLIGRLFRSNHFRLFLSRTVPLMVHQV